MQRVFIPNLRKYAAGLQDCMSLDGDSVYEPIPEIHPDMSLPGLANGVLDLFYGGGVLLLRDQILEQGKTNGVLYSHRTAAFFIPQLFVNGIESVM